LKLEVVLKEKKLMEGGELFNELVKQNLEESYRLQIKISLINGKLYEYKENIDFSLINEKEKNLSEITIHPKQYQIVAKQIKKEITIELKKLASIIFKKDKKKHLHKKL
jgi:hypothetical protein